MPTNFPTSLDTFATRVNNVDTIDASHVNNLQDSVAAIETLLGASSSRRTTWSPELTYSTTNPTSITYSGSNAGFYARFGSIIYVTARVEVATRSGGSGDFRISLPVATSSTPNSHAIFTIYGSGTGFGATAWPMTGIASLGNAYFTMNTYSATATGTTISTTTAGTTTAFNMWFSGFYWT